MKKGGNVNRFKPENTRFVDAREKLQFKSVGWYKFLQKNSGENVALAQPFSEIFDGEKVKLGRKTFNISESIIAHATQTSAIGERWFKNKMFPIEVSIYLKPEHVNVKWNPTTHISSFKSEWRHVITTVQKYITCKGRFSSVHHYQMIFLAHILGDKPMNLPYFLYKSLLKMSQKLQKIPNYPLHNLYHRGLIKILIV